MAKNLSLFLGILPKNPFADVYNLQVFKKMKKSFSRGLTRGIFGNKIKEIFILKGGNPWTRAVVAIYRVEVVCSVCGTLIKAPVFCLISNFK